MSSEAAASRSFTSALAQLPARQAELSAEAGKTGHVHRKRGWQQKFQHDLIRYGLKDEPNEAEVEAVEALKSAKVARVTPGQSPNEVTDRRFVRGGSSSRQHVEEGQAVLRPAAVHAHRPVELGGNGAFSPPPTLSRGLYPVAHHALARRDSGYNKVGNMEELLAHLHHRGGSTCTSAGQQQGDDAKGGQGEAADFEISMDNIGGGRKGRNARRGPMDEMRQLVRILVKIVPQSLPHLATTEDGGGNRISEEQIKYYLEKTLGEAPRPDWGLPRGWGHYLAVLFEWATCRPFTEDEARMCAKRLPGRSWEAVESVLEQFCLRPHTWKLPLQRGTESIDGLWLLTDDNRTSQRVSPEEESVKQPKKPKVCLPNLNKADSLPEAELWKLVLHLVKVAAGKQGTTPAHLRDSLEATKREVREAVEASVGVSPTPTSAPPQPSSSANPTPTFLSPNLSGLQSVDLQSLQQAISSQGLQGLQLSQLLQPQQQSIPVSGINLASAGTRLGGMLSGINPSSSHPNQGALEGITALQGPAAANLLLNRQVLLPSGQGAFQQLQHQQVQNIPIHSFQPREPDANAPVGASGKPADLDVDPVHKSAESGVGGGDRPQLDKQGKESPTTRSEPSGAASGQGQAGVSMLANAGSNSGSQKSHLIADLSTISTGGLLPLLNYSCYGANHNSLNADTDQQKAQQPNGQTAGGNGSQQQQQQQQQNNMTLAGLYANQYNRGGLSALQLSGGQLVYADLGNQFQQVQGLGQLQGFSQLNGQNPMSTMLGAQPVLLALHQPSLGFPQSQMIGGGVLGGVAPGQQGVQQVMQIGNNSG